MSFTRRLEESKYWNGSKSDRKRHLRARRAGGWRTPMKVNAEVKNMDTTCFCLKQAHLSGSGGSFIMGLCDGLSHCKLALVFAVLMDLLGGATLLVGVFVPLEIKGQDYGDLLVYSGVLFVLMSLAGWLLWYSGNIDGLTSKKELGHMDSVVDRLARNLSRKIRTYRGQH
ncbi:transmembrane protein 238-like [Micropterus salmoides]|uniref:transmembrane protein 238-like n=1 Tax=Micropterus salmoides TaxID=27706 RepID=UPI0018ED1E8D|nr:transmembrane protein 238-like [Micropterus salmoides]